MTKNTTLPLLACLLGVIAAHHPMIFSGLSQIQVDQGDSRFINYVLEHSYQWLKSAPGHRAFWSPPFYFPSPNAAAYSDVFMMVAPVYWVFRILGSAPDTAFQLWMIALSVLNYLVAFVMLRRGFKASVVAASAGAFLLAFGAPRMNQIGHQQLLSTLFPCMVLLALARVFSEREAPWLRRFLYWLMASIALVAQLYSGFYLGWFLLFGLAIATICGLLVRSTRWTLIPIVRRDFLAMLLAGIVGVVALGPFWAHYRAAAKEIGPRFYPAVRMSIPHFWSWWNVGPHDWVWGWTSRFDVFRTLIMEIEHRIGLGVVTPIVCGLGLYFGRCRPICRIAGLAWLVMIGVSTYLPGESIANGATVLALVGMTWIFFDYDRPRLRLMVLAGLLTLITFEMFPSQRVIGLAHYLLILCLIEAFRQRDQPRMLAFQGLVIAWINFRVFDVTMLLASGAVFLILAGLGWWKTQGARIVVPLGLTAWCAFAALVSLEIQPSAVAIGIGAAVVFLPLLYQRNMPIRPELVARCVLLALPVIVILEFRDTLWDLVYENVPGASAIRSVARIGLATLVPATIGLVMFIDGPAARRKPWLAVVFVLFCLLEQGITTPVYDKAVTRAHHAEVAALVPDGCLTFYYRPRPGEFREWHYQIDAMWASLARGIPTINGYSGGSPRDWTLFAHVDDEFGPSVEQALNTWIRLKQLPRNRVARIGETESGKVFQVEGK